MVDLVTGEVDEREPMPEEQEKDPAAVDSLADTCVSLVHPGQTVG